MAATVLIVEDERNLREGLREAIQSPNLRVLAAENAFQAEEILRDRNVDLVLADLKMPGISGLELLRQVHSFSPSTPFIIMTAYGTVDTAVEAMKEGAYDYLTKPVNIDQLELLIARALKGRELERENLYLKEQLQKKYGLEHITGRSRAMEKVLELIRQVSDTNSTVLITGESGTGKEVVARTIHQQSFRRNRPFIAIHCAALSPSLLESELFGHERGAFTGAVSRKKGKFEVADGGTVFLDEVNEIPLEMQVKLLRFLEMRELERVGGTESIPVDVRLLAASNANLEELIRKGGMREDLYFRLNVVRIKLPPLRERPEDIPLLVHEFISELSRANHKEISSITPVALRALQAYPWPGNVRELKNCLESMIVLAKNPVLDLDNLPPTIHPAADRPESAEGEVNLKKLEKKAIVTALKRSSGNKSQAAELLGVSRRTLYRKLEEYGLAMGSDKTTNVTANSEGAERSQTGP